MKSTIYYIHGWGSSPSSGTAYDLKKAFANEKFFCPHIHHDRDPESIKALMDEIGRKAQKEHDPIIVGSSAGGFWADYIGTVYGIKTVLINPSLRPSINFVKYNLPQKYIDKYKTLEKRVANHARHHMTAFFGEKDDVVPIDHVTDKYKPTMLKDEGHRLNNLTPVIKRIQSMIGNIPEHD